MRETWPERLDLVAIDGKTSRRSHDRNLGAAAPHLVSAFAATERLVLGQEAVVDKSNETTAIPVLLERLGRNGGLKGALVSIDAIATHGAIAKAIGEQGADYPLAVKANPPTLRAEVEACFGAAPSEALDTFANLDARRAAAAVRGHWAIENSLHWTLDVVFKEDQSRLRKGHGARNMAVVRHFAFNIVRTAADKRSLKSRRKIAGCDTSYLATLLRPTHRQPGFEALP